MRFTLVHLAHLMGQKLRGFRSAPSSIEFGPGLYARHDYAIGDVIVKLAVNMKKLEGAMVGDGLYNCWKYRYSGGTLKYPMYLFFFKKVGKGVLFSHIIVGSLGKRGLGADFFLG